MQHDLGTHFDAPTATFAAALVAAAASLLTLILKVVFDRNSEARSTYRQSLAPLIEELGSALHMIVAVSLLSFKDKSEAHKPYWANRVAVPRSTLRALRPKVRYPLWGLDRAIRTMSYLPSAVAAKRELDKGEFIRTATYLRYALDNSIRRCYRYGRPPSLIERWYVAYRLRKLEGLWERAGVRLEPDIKKKEAQPTLYPKIYATIAEIDGEEFVAHGDDGRRFRVRISNKNGKGSRSDAAPGKRVKLYKRDGEEFFRYRFGGS